MGSQGSWTVRQLVTHTEEAETEDSLDSAHLCLFSPGPSPWHIAAPVQEAFLAFMDIPEACFHGDAKSHGVDKLNLYKQPIYNYQACEHAGKYNKNEGKKINRNRPEMTLIKLDKGRINRNIF